MARRLAGTWRIVEMDLWPTAGSGSRRVINGETRSTGLDYSSPARAPGSCDATPPVPPSRRCQARPVTVVDVGLGHPVPQTGLGDPEVFGNLGDRLLT